MEKEKVKGIRRLYDHGVKTYDIGMWLALSLNEVDIELDEYEHALSSIEEEYFANEWPKVLSSVKEMKDSIVPEVKRLEYERAFALAQIKEKKETGVSYQDPELQRLYLKGKILTARLEGLSPERVARAREFPLADLVGKSRNGIASCPFHTDKTPSMDIRKNFFHCYSCGEHGDVIDYVMKTENLTFKQAVSRLSP